MKKACITITLTTLSGPKMEVKCGVTNGKSARLNEIAQHISNELPAAVASALESYVEQYKKELIDERH